MANYIKDSLEEGEQIVLKGRLHWTSIAKYLVTTWLLVAAGCAGVAVWAQSTDGDGWLYGGLAAVVLALVVYLWGRIIRTRTEFAITSTRFIQKDGIFDVKMTEIPLFKVETVNFYQSFFQRILNTGSIELVGSGGTCHKITCIESPMKVRKTIVGTINAQQGDERSAWSVER